jgi:hypothetical protein
MNTTTDLLKQIKDQQEKIIDLEDQNKRFRSGARGHLLEITARDENDFFLRQSITKLKEKHKEEILYHEKLIESLRQTIWEYDQKVDAFEKQQLEEKMERIMKEKMEEKMERIMVEKMVEKMEEEMEEEKA